MTTPVAWRERLILADGRAVQIVTSHFAVEVGVALPELARPALLPVIAPELVARAGFVVAFSRDVPLSRLASEAEAGALEVEAGHPVLEVLHTDRGADGGVLMVERDVSDSMRLRVAWEVRRP